MAVISKGQTFAAGDQVTALKLNNLADNATFTSGAVDNVSTQLSGGAIVVKDGGVTTAKLNDSAVTTVKIADANVTTAKIANANVTFAKLTDVIDDDTMATASATKLATSESIKAYTDTRALDPTREYNSFNHSTVSGTIIENTTGRPLWVSFTCLAADNIDYLLLEISPNSNMSSLTRIAQSRIKSDGTGSNSAAQVCGIVPSGWYWKVTYSGNGAFSEQVHCSFAL